MSQKKLFYSALVWGTLGSIGIGVIFYLAQLLGMQDFWAPLSFSLDKWYFVIPLIVGFGVQMGLFRAIHLKSKEGGIMVAASGGVSGTAMVLCCMHNLVTLFPILGLTGIAVFFAQYQDYVFGFSVLFMLGGIFYMWNKYRDLHSCCQKNNLTT